MTAQGSCCEREKQVASAALGWARQHMRAQQPKSALPPGRCQNQQAAKKPSYLVQQHLLAPEQVLPDLEEGDRGGNAESKRK
jgi:hypothetical protein